MGTKWFPLCIVSVSLLVLSGLPAEAGVPGDLNGDGQRTLTDVRWCIEMLVGLRAKDLTTADLTSDGQFTLADLQALIRLLVSGGSVPPTITTPPANQTVSAGQSATFSVVASGTAPLAYQW